MDEVKEYAGACLEWAIGRYTAAHLLMGVTLGVVILLGIGGIGFAVWQQEWAWLLALVPLGAMVFLLAPYFVWRADRRKVTEYETKQLGLGVEEDDDRYLQRRGGNWIFRVGVMACGMSTIENVEVTLKSVDGGRNAYADAPLRPACCLPNEPSAIGVKPGEPRFVEVMSWGSDGKEIGIHYGVNP